MRVKMDVVQEQHKQGVFKSINVHALHIRAELTEVEKAAIDKSGIGTRVIHCWPLAPTVAEKDMHLYPNGEFRFLVNDLMKTETVMKFEALIDALQTMRELEKELPLVKSMMAAADAPTSTILEI